MTKDQLLSLAKQSQSTLADIQKADPALAAVMSTTIAAQRQQAVLSGFAGSSTDLLAAVDKVDFSPTTQGTKTSKDILAEGLTNQKISADLAKEAAQRMIDLDRQGLLADAAAPSTVIANHPLFQTQLQTAKVYMLAATAGLADAKADAVAAAAPSPSLLDDDKVAALVTSNTLTAAEATHIGIATAVLQLSNGDTAVAQSLSGTMKSFADIATISVADWQKTIESAGSTPPDGLDVPTYAAALRRAATNVFPSTALFSTAAAPQAQDLTPAITAVQSLAAKNPRLLTSRFELLDTTDLKPADVAAARPAQEQLRALVALHPGLELDKVMTSSDTPAQKAAAVQTRIGLLQQVAALNPTTEFLGLDLTAGSADIAALNLKDVNADDQKLVINDLQATQRVYSLTRDVDNTQKLMTAGYHSAASIAQQRQDTFAAASGLTVDAANAIHEKSSSILSQVSNSVLSAIDAFGNLFNRLNVGNTLPEVQDYIKGLPGFADLFGNQDYCDCDECQSIIGAAAYFVDLMSFIETNILDLVFTGTKATDTLNLKVRRPDLWTLPLTCDNTNTLIPYLDVINQTLENYIATQRGFAGDITNRSAVEETVYHQLLSSSQGSFRQPFTLPLAKLDIYLEHFSVSRLDVARALASTPAVEQNAALKISDSVRSLLLVANVTPAWLNGLYGITFTLTAGVVDPLDVQDMLRATGMSHQDFAATAQSLFVANVAANKPQIISEKSDPTAVQNDIERIHGLTPDALDRIHRFTRLRRQTKWSVAELDLILAQLSLAGLVPVSAGITADTLARLVQVMDLQKRWSLPVDQNCALWGPIPVTPLVSAQDSLFNRLFNFKPFVLLDGQLPKDTVRFLHSSFRASGTPLPADNTTHRLLAGLQVLDSDLAALIAALAVPLGMNLANADETQRGFLLTAANLGLLYRHAQLAGLMGLPVTQLFQLIQIAQVPNGYVQNLDALVSLLKAFDWVTASGYTLDQLGYVTGGPVLQPNSFPNATQIAARIEANVAQQNALAFAPSVFAFLPGVTEQQSLAIVTANPTLFEPVPGSTAGALRLTGNFNPAVVLTIPAGIPLTSPAAVAALLKYHSSQIVPAQLVSQLGLDADYLPALFAMSGTDLSAASMVQAVEGGAAAPLINLINQVNVLQTAFGLPGFDTAGLTFVQQNPGLFGVANLNRLTLANLYSLVNYEQAAVGLIDATPLRSALSAFTPATFFAAADTTALATALGVDAAVLATLLPNVQLPATAPEAFAMLAGVASLAKTLGVGGDTLQLLINPAYAGQSLASDAVLSAFRAQHSNEQNFLDNLKPFDDRIRSRKRDGLTDFILRSLGLKFTTLDDLYNFFLLDVQLEGCAQTSWVVAAISSAQLYVYRCLMNLEQDQRDVNDPAHVHVDPKLIPGDEWEWRQNYRVWQANRKVFLYPENYIEPGLRDDKTPLFKDLESNLLQQPINEQNVLDAYGAYLSGFDEISRLRIAGSYQDIDKSSRSDALHLFGVSPGDPPTYYYRTIQNAIYGETETDRNVTYSPWQLISVQIPGREVAPVVYLGRLFVFWTEVTTTPLNTVSGGGSTFTGYRHHLSIKYTSLRLDGSWTAPQSISLASNGVFPSGDGIVDDPLSDPAEQQAAVNALASFNFTQYFAEVTLMQTPRYDTRIHTEPIDGYTLQGFQWDRVYPQAGSSLDLTARNFVLQANVDFYRKSIDVLGQLDIGFMSAPTLCSQKVGGNRQLYSGQQFARFIEQYPWSVCCSSEDNINKLKQTTETAFLAGFMSMGLYTRRLAAITDQADIAVINNSEQDAVLDTNGDLLLIQSSVKPSGFILRRLSTTLGERLSRILFVSGVDGLLQFDTQSNLGEAGLPLTPNGSAFEIKSPIGAMDFKGSLGTYFREIFFHVPFLIASQLNSQQKYAAAQKWYQYIFDPTADDPTNIPATATSAQRERLERDRVWRYIEFKNLGVPKLREILTDPAAIEAYKKDPFNPHAIARLRLSTYQKSIVMKYVDNLIDWADSLFTEFTMESVNEATLLYVMALDILGPRPADIGSCGQAPESNRTYAAIAPLIKAGSDFLIEMETSTIVVSKPGSLPPKQKPSQQYILPHEQLSFYVKEAVSHFTPKQVNANWSRIPLKPVAGLADTSAGGVRRIDGPAAINLGDGITTRASVQVATPVNAEYGLAQQYAWKQNYVASWKTDNGKTSFVSGNAKPSKSIVGRAPHYGWSVVKQVIPVFCIPDNDDLLEYWNRLEDRLYKIRHCEDITGTKRQLALFAPPIDPMLLVEAMAGGLSLDDVVSSLSGDLPPYRFTYLIEKAKQYAQQVQSFGAALLSALDRRDAEQLNILHLTQQQNILSMTTKLRQQEIDQAQNAIDSLTSQQATIQYRHDYYQGLLDAGMNAMEITQSVSRHTASATFIASALLAGTGGVLHLVPQLGSPFAMKYGGMELGSSAKAWSKMLGDTAKLAGVIAASAGLQAGFERRDEGWKHQVDLASKELDQIARQLKGAGLRLQSAQQSLSIHQKTIQQAKDVFDFYKNRFTNLGLYTWLATTMQRVYRDAFNGAYAMAKLTEQAYRFERNDDTSGVLADNYWSAAQNGLLSGERLLGDLQDMERRFIESNYRALEVDQTFSLAQISPAALLSLRENATCDFTIPELAFDLFYPGQYCRQIRAVRLTIPTVTGPFTNVSATLTLTGSKLRLKPQLGAANLQDVPVRRSVSIATSTGQSDSGVFEFSFRDERYMPFEGAGGISTWNLMLPQAFRQFDYDTIPDVLVHISYTAQQDGTLRQSVEQQNAGLQGTLLNVLKNQPIGRLFSLRQEFSSALNRLQHSALNTPVKITLTDKHLPVFVRGHGLTVTRAELLLSTSSAQTVHAFQIALDTTTLSVFTRDATLGNLWSADILSQFNVSFIGDHTLEVKNAGDLAPVAPVAGDLSALDDSKLTDILLYVEYKLL